jgi:hypothetical protein
MTFLRVPLYFDQLLSDDLRKFEYGFSLYFDKHLAAA